MSNTRMERVAALYDIHGNLPALEAAMAAVEAAGADTIVVGGDVVLGPMPRETLERLLALGPRARFIRGNCDRLVVDAFDGRPLPPRLPPAVREPIAWTAAQLDRTHRDALAGFPETLALGVDGLGEVLFCHATPRSDEEIYTVRTPADGVRLLNAGSVGMPYGRPGAYWLLLGPDAQPARTDYDLERAADLVRHTSYPQAAEFAERQLLRPQSEEEILRLFEPAAG